ncbi:MAG: phosphatase PAP2 family protein [Acidimicrobiales bacterium]
MRWPSWDEAAIATVVLLVVAYAANRMGGRWRRVVAAFCRETALISFLYMLWRLARQLPLVQEEGAYDRGRQIWDLQRALHLPSELSMERWLQGHDLLAHWTVSYYAGVHVPALLIFLLWLWVRHRDRYPRWRNALAITTGFCLLIRFVRVAPPRLLPELGFVDLPAELGRDIYGPVGTGASDQFAAMPSIHVAWACIVCFGIFTSTTSRWRWIGPIHLALTFWCVMATANHWWMDGIVACALVGLSLLIDDGARRLLARHRSSPAEEGRSVGDGAGSPLADPVPSA